MQCGAPCLDKETSKKVGWVYGIIYYYIQSIESYIRMYQREGLTHNYVDVEIDHMHVHPLFVH